MRDITGCNALTDEALTVRTLSVELSYCDVNEASFDDDRYNNL